MKNRCLWILLLLGTCAYACSNEDVNPSGEEQNMFASPDFSTEEEMAIRDNFFEKTGIYLIFNDSLCWREVETPSGIWKMCETLNLNYEFSNMSSNIMQYKLSSDIANKEAMANLLADELLPLTPESMRPYAFFVVDSFSFAQGNDYNDTGDPELMAAMACYNTTVVGMNGVLEMDEAEFYSYKQQFMRGILLKNYILLGENVYTDFYVYCADAYGINPGYTDAEKWAAGFLTSYYGVSGYYKEYDIPNYIWEIYSMTEEEFDMKYADYPLVLQKKNTLVRIFEECGIAVYEF